MIYRNDTTSGSIHIRRDAQQGLEQDIYSPRRQMRSRKNLHHMVSRHGSLHSALMGQIFRLGLTAFRVVLVRKPTVYKSLLKLLDFELSQGRYRRHKKQFRSLVRNGAVVIDQLSF